MDAISEKYKSNLSAYLRSRRVSPTCQRLQIARILFAKTAHFSADDVYNEVNKQEDKVSRATVYNTLGLFVKKGLIREVLVDPSKVFYDSNTVPHHHFYDIDTGEIQDIDPERITLDVLPELPAGKSLDSVEVVVRLRNK